MRANPLANLEYLEPCVRAYYVKRVVLVGAESTGKSTLARILAEHFQTRFVAEYGREHWEQKVAGLTMNDPLPAWSDEEFVHMLVSNSGEKMKRHAPQNKLLICDTNAFATVLGTSVIAASGIPWSMRLGNKIKPTFIC